MYKKSNDVNNVKIIQLISKASTYLTDNCEVSFAKFGDEFRSFCNDLTLVLCI